MLIKPAIRDMGLVPIAQLQLAVGRRLANIDAGSAQPPEMFVSPARINNMEGSVTALESSLNEGEQHTVLLVHVMEERTDVTRVIELGAGTGYGRRDS